VVLIEDVTTKGGSVMQAVNARAGAGRDGEEIITIVDRLEGAEANLKKKSRACADLHDQGSAG